jgi:hypothetical protein
MSTPVPSSGPRQNASEAKLFGKQGSALRIAGCAHRMLTREVPVSTVLFQRQSIAGREMPPEHLAAPAAFEANDKISMN